MELLRPRIAIIGMFLPNRCQQTLLRPECFGEIPINRHSTTSGVVLTLKCHLLQDNTNLGEVVTRLQGCPWSYFATMLWCDPTTESVRP